jgi:hypothetical protein
MESQRTAIYNGYVNKADKIKKKSMLACKQCGKLTTNMYCSKSCMSKWSSAQHRAKEREAAERQRRRIVTMHQSMEFWDGWVREKEYGISYGARIGVVE